MAKNLYNLTEVTTVNNSDLLHVNQGSVSSDKKVTKQNLLKEVNSSISSINNSLANSLHGVATVPSNGNKSLSIGGSTRALVGVFGFSNEATQIYIVTSTSGGATYAYPVKTSTGMSASISGTTMTLTNSTGSNAYVCAVVFSGSVESA